MVTITHAAVCPKLLTLREAAGALKVSAKTLARLIAAGRIRSTKIGDRRTFVTESEIARVIAQGTTEGDR